MRIVETDNFGSDYPDESFVNLPSLPKDTCHEICNTVNNKLEEMYENGYSRFYKVVENDYKLQPGFEP